MPLAVQPSAVVHRRPDPVEAPHVLVVEDNAVNRKLAQLILQKLGCSVDLAENGAEGVRMFPGAGYDAVFMDCQMPVMDGFEAATRIRADGGDESCVPIIAVTANVLPDDLDRCFAAGMDGVITKPVRPNDFAEALALWCQYPPAADA